MKIYGGIKHNVPKIPELSRENVLTKLIATNSVWVLEKKSFCVSKMSAFNFYKILHKVYNRKRNNKYHK